MHINKPSAGEIEAYYLSDSSLSPEWFAAVSVYVDENYVDGGTRAKFIAQRKRIEDEIAAVLDE